MEIIERKKCGVKNTLLGVKRFQTEAALEREREREREKKSKI